MIAATFCNSMFPVGNNNKVCDFGRLNYDRPRTVHDEKIRNALMSVCVTRTFPIL